MTTIHVPDDEGPETYLMLPEVARLFGVHVQTVREWMRSGRLPTVRLGWRTIRVRRTDLFAFIRERYGPAPSAAVTATMARRMPAQRVVGAHRGR